MSESARAGNSDARKMVHHDPLYLASVVGISKTMSSGPMLAFASMIACLSVPGPASSVIFTVKVSANTAVGTAGVATKATRTKRVKLSDLVSQDTIQRAKIFIVRLSIKKENRYYKNFQNGILIKILIKI